MIKPGFIKKQVQKSREAGKCTRILAELTFLAADRALREHYGENYSIRCLQSSLAVKTILTGFGISSTLWGEHVCVAEAFEAPLEYAWGGFWNEERHMWLYTELSEVVDLTIGQLHIHPQVPRQDMVAIPPIWWQEISRWPNTIRYLPTARITPGLKGDEKKDLDAFLRLVPEILNEILEDKDVTDISFEPVLYGEASMNQLTLSGHPWLFATLPMRQQKIPMPPWVQEKERELTNRAMQRRQTSRRIQTCFPRYLNP
jgi:hypothetical protein